MRIAVAAMGKTVAGHFGHCENFIFYDTEDGKIVAEESVGKSRSSSRIPAEFSGRSWR